MGSVGMIGVAERKVAFIDDNVLGLRYYHAVLERWGFEVLPIRDVDSALSLKKEEWESFDAVILDIMMPPGKAYEDAELALIDRTGVLLFHDIREIVPNIAILVLTNLDPAFLRSEIRETARIEICFKPKLAEDREALGQKLDDLLAIPDWYDTIVDTMSELLNLPENWNGGGEKAIDWRIVDSANDVLRAIAVDTQLKPHVVPTNGGGVQIEIYDGNRHFEIEFLSETTVWWYWNDSTMEDEKEEELGEDWRERIIGLIKQVLY